MTPLVCSVAGGAASDLCKLKLIFTSATSVVIKVEAEYQQAETPTPATTADAATPAATKDADMSLRQTFDNHVVSQLEQRFNANGHVVGISCALEIENPPSQPG